MSPILEHRDGIDKASIIENKIRTKTYWEQLMMAAAKENNSEGRMRQWTVPDEMKKSDSCCNRNIYSCDSPPNIFGEDSLKKRNSGNYDVDWDSDSDMIIRKNCLNEKCEKKKISKNNVSPDTMEGKIALELQEMKEREEELKEWRNKFSIENCKVISLPKDVLIANRNEELMSSLHTTDDSNYSEYGSEEKEHSLDEIGSRGNTPNSDNFMHGRTQSLDSVSSGLSSGSSSTLNERDRELLKRKVSVRPYEDPEEESYQCYIWDGKETPIEREIRLAIEREDELKREKGIYNIMENCRALSQKIKNKSERHTETMENDPRGIQHKLATIRIQQEIEEANERERELKTEGKIISTSEDTLDSKVTRLEQLVENSIAENKFREQKVKRSSIVLTTNKKFVETNENHMNGKCKARGKSVMEKFFSTKGKPFAAGLNVQTFTSGLECQPRPITRQSVDPSEDAIVYIRKGYMPVVEKIIEELKDNKMREEELRSQRARSLARSQPNLTDIFDIKEERVVTSWKSEEKSPSPVPRLIHSVSNPNLLDDSFDKVHKRPSNKKFSLLQEWEKRIREYNQKD